MTIRTVFLKEWAKWGGSLAVFLGFALGVVVAMLWLAGKFQPKVPTEVTPSASETADLKGRTAPVEMISVPLYESAVGTIRPVHEMSIEAKLPAQVVEVRVDAGTKVKKGDLLMRLDAKDVNAKLDQARAALVAAETLRNNARDTERRYAPLLGQNSISREEYDAKATALRSAEANVKAAQAALEGAKTAVSWTEITAPVDGKIIERKVNVGDMASPGKSLVTLYDPKRMQLVATVRESLIRQLQQDHSIDVWIEGLNKQCSGMISEIVPEAQPESRSFQVKVTGPCPPGIYSGMFGRILVPLGDDEQVPVISKRAIKNIGQLELVDVVEDGRVSRRAIRTGRRFDAEKKLLAGPREAEAMYVEVLSGLRAPRQQGGKTVAGESVLLDRAAQEATHE